MGAAQSQEAQLRRNSSSRKSPKRDDLQTKFDAIENVKTEIDLFGGNRQSERYSQIQETLASISKDFQEKKLASSKPKTRNRCDDGLGDIQHCLKRLETRVDFNEHSLDSAAVESHSFIQSFAPHQQASPMRDEIDIAKSISRIGQEAAKLEHDIELNIEWSDQKLFEQKIQFLYKELDSIFVDNRTPLGEQKAKIADRLAKCSNQLKRAQSDMRKSRTEEALHISDKPRETLSRIEEDTQKLERDIKLCIELDDYNQLKLLKRKIQLLYTDLEMIVVENHTPLSEQKAAIGKRLIKYNNQIRKNKRGNLQQLENIDKKVERLGAEALLFEGIGGDIKCKSIQQELENYWTMVYPFECVNDEEKNKKAHIVAKIKNTMDELAKRVEANRREFEALGKLTEQSTKINELQGKTTNFVGRANDPAFGKIDKELRFLWTVLSEIEDVSEKVRGKKGAAITQIQTALNTLNERALCHEEARIPEETEESILLNKVKSFENQWNGLNHNLQVHKISSDVSKLIVDVLKRVSNGTAQKVNALDVIEKRRSTGSLVTVKILDTVGEVKRLPPPVETEIKAQPAVKAIGEMQRIGLQAKAILQEIRESKCTKHDKEYERLRSMLEECRSSLEKIDYNKKSDTIESNKRRALKTIMESIRVLEEKPSKNSKACEVMDIHAEIQYFRQQIKTFTGVTKDLNYSKIKQGLSDCLVKLQLIDDDLAIKQDNIRQIQFYHQELETKLAENQAKVKINKEIADAKRQIAQETKNVIEDVQKLKSQVERFSGVYDGLQFQQIQENLNKCSRKLDGIDIVGDEKLENARTQTKQKIQKYLQVLEERSSKPEIVPESSPHRKINVLRDRLVDIKVKTEEFDGKYKDAGYAKIEEELARCLQELKVIDDRGHRSIVLSKEQYEEYIVKLLQYFEDKTKTSEADEEIADPSEELAAIGHEVADLKGRIDAGTSDLAKLQEKGDLLREQLANVNAGDASHKKQLLEDLEGCKLLLMRKRRNQEKFDHAWKKIVEVADEVERFVGVKNDKNYCRLDEVLIQLMMELDKIDCSGNSDMKVAKQQAMQMIQKSMATLDRKASSSSFSATVV
ncbi:early endosome antigen 1-like [Photinus pyralis]|nr:early endosome antigen 1-like [Photinus pyralis]